MPRTNIERNRFYQVLMGAPGCLPSRQVIYTTKKQAKRAARVDAARCREYATVYGTAEDGKYQIDLDRTRASGTDRYIKIVGPMTAEEMGYDDLEHCIRHNELEHMDGAQRVLS